MTTLTTTSVTSGCNRRRSTTVTNLGAEAYCVIFGDPHVIPFDHPKTCGKRHCSNKERVGIFDSGDFWIVNSKWVHIQGRYWSDNKNGKSAARALAVGGPFLQGNRLIIEQGSGGKIYWNEQVILFDTPSDFRVEGLIDAQTHLNHADVVQAKFGWGKKWNNRRKRDIVQSVDVELPLGIKLRVNRLSYRIDLRISMRQLHGGQDGHCGNFNGDASDDTTKSIKSRSGHQVHGKDLLFDKKEYEYVGCFGDLESDRDLPMQATGSMVRFGGHHIDIVGCSTFCSGYKYFARQSHGECFCGDSYGKYGPVMGCACDTAMVGHSRNCVYKLLDAAQTPSNPTLEDCPHDRREQGELRCAQSFGDDEHSQVFVDACVFDFCFGGGDFLDTDALAAETLSGPSRTP
jgi:hypothetical protein